jgi:hypothetical protein
MSNQEKFINTFYSQGMRVFLKKLGMKLTSSKLFNLGISRQSFCYSKEINENFIEKCIVVGGPCIKDCENAITIEAVYEIFNIIKTAKGLSAPGIIFIGLQEEILQYGEKQCYYYLGKNLERVIGAIANFLEYKNITIIDTRENHYNSLMREFLRKKNSLFNIREVNTIFEFGNRKYKSHNEAWIDATKRVTIAHVPLFLNAYLKNKDRKNILVVENTQQIKIIKLAQLIESTENGPYQVAHLPVPGVSGSERMYRAPYWDKVYLNENKEDLAVKQILAPKEVFEFWMKMFVDIETKTSNSQLSELVLTLNNIIYGKQKN